ncbi:sulfatase-like hydrolase/transferase [Actibacterium sp. 188UL27-1]|uniref:sulfatase-like hydrolase/transferase n=1 Tax=Actibacterium sp. 188UL27-1 TaxID=2786961 RepID=UPI00195C4427|nr:sulfatase-like hydrolase/transferase [Actibacterium sp. 188UL27-1]MBM7069334.1 sulfatase-like hydrolase/transferase [Actibacterium sp. 188UL27-1]
MGNLLVLMSDEHQARAMGCAGHPFVQTPNLDALAARGLRFTNAYTPSPICVPARSSFATGCYVHQTRLWDNAMPYDGTIAGWGHVLQRQGVCVESIGKLHYRSAEDPAGFDREHLPMMVADGVGMVWASIRNEDERLTDRPRMLGDYIGPGHSTYTDYDAAVVERTVRWLAEAPDQDWCLFVGLVAPHFPLVVPQRYFDQYPVDDLPQPKLHPATGYRQHPWIVRQNAIMDTEAQFESPEERLRAMASYYGLVTWLDDNIGKILDALDHAGLANDTTVVYTSDHGENLGARGLWGKSNMYEESAAVPLILSAPQCPTGTCETPVSLIDLSQTIADTFGAALPPASPGRSLHAIAAEPADPDRIVFSEYHAAGAVSGAFMLRKGRWKLIHYVGFAPELFDLQNDPDERMDRAADPHCAAILADLMVALHRICDPEQVDALAHQDQAAMIARSGGREVALTLGAPAATPPPRFTP